MTRERFLLLAALLIGSLIGYALCGAMDAVRARHVLTPGPARVETLRLQAAPAPAAPTKPDTFPLIDCHRHRPPCLSAD